MKRSYVIVRGLCAVRETAWPSRGRAGCGRGARASVEASRPVAASGLGAPASRPVDADAADARTTADTQAVHTVAITWYCVVSQIVQRPEGARCSELHTFAIARDDQLAILPGRSVSAPKGCIADSNLRGDRREPQQLVLSCTFAFETSVRVRFVSRCCTHATLRRAPARALAASAAPPHRLWN